MNGIAKLGIPRLGILRNRTLELREVWRTSEVYLCAILIFVTSRVVVAIGLGFGTLLVEAQTPGKWDAGDAWYHRLLRWDSGVYLSILRDGYHYSDDAAVHNSTVFYPLYPLVSYAVKSVFGVDEGLALLVVANVAALIAALLMTKLVKDDLGDKIALSSVAFFCFFPSSFFLSAGYTEPLCLVFVLLSLILLAHKKFVLAAVMAGLSLGARSTGIVMIPVILWEMVRADRLPWFHLLRRIALTAFLAASGLLIFMAYLGIKFGHPLAFASGQAAWQGAGLIDRFIFAVTLAPFWHSNWLRTGPFLGFLVLTLWSFRHLRISLSLYALGVLMLPYLTLGITGSMNRFVLMCFPAFMSLGLLCNGWQWLGNLLIGFFAALLLLNSALFSQWYWVG